MRVLFVTALLTVGLPRLPSRGLRLSEDLFLTTDRAYIAGFLSGPFECLAGRLEANAIRGAPGVVHSVTDQDEAAFTHAQAERFALEQLSLTNMFLTALWLVKDNAANVERGFTEYPCLGRIGSNVSSNFWAVRYGTAGGDFAVCNFTEEELRLGRDLLRNLFGGIGPSLPGEWVGRTIPVGSSRLDRVFYRLQAARMTGDLGEKIANYISCLETLFSTDAAELAHKLSERVAFFCRNTPQERLGTFKTLKNAYTIRSKTVHGDKLSTRLAEGARDVSVECDRLVRESLHKILTTPGLPDTFKDASDKLEDYLNRLVFGLQETADCG